MNGIDRTSNSSHVGRIGEFFAMYILEKNGIECHHVDRSGIDLWCQSYNDAMFTVQVKAANVCIMNTNRGNKLRYVYNLRSKKIADFYVFVALDIEKLLVRSTEELGCKKSIQLHPNLFNAESQAGGMETLWNFTKENAR
tara:strand:- start:14821 stop:15240 length:420 start_codon:yes stop_codon:yes gene_type:complete